jgi:hypothetical protein
MELGNLFGKYQKALTAEFQMFAPFDDEKNVLFQVNPIIEVFICK